MLKLQIDLIQIYQNSFNRIQEQCDPSSDLLLLCFINDIVSNFNNNIDGVFTIHEVKLFILLFPHTPTALQLLLNDLFNYCHLWALTVNTRKTKVMIFGLGRPTTHKLFNNEILELVMTFKYLGMHLFQYTTHLPNLLTMIYVVIVLNQLDLTIPDKCKLVDSLAGSIINYGIQCRRNNKYVELD